MSAGVLAVLILTKYETAHKFKQNAQLITL